METTLLWRVSFVLAFPAAYALGFAIVSILCWNEKRKKKDAEQAKQVGRLIRCIDV